VSVTRPRAIFFGTPAFAVPCLRALTEVADVVAVISQPDRPRGRGMRLGPTPVKEAAQQLGVPVQQPTRIRTPVFAEELRALQADVALVVAYGRILPVGVLEAPRLGCLNVHASLLPRWRGAAPIQWAVVGGDTETGVCLMQMDEGMDTGPVLARVSTPIGVDETAGELADRLATMGAGLVHDQVLPFVQGLLTPVAQIHEDATSAPLLTKEHGILQWDRPAKQVHDRIRGMSPWPGARSRVASATVKIHRAHVVIEDGRRGEPGTILASDRHGIIVACGAGALAIDELQLEGKRRLDAGQFLSGHRWADGTRFESPGTA